MIKFEGEVFNFSRIQGTSQRTGQPYDGAEYRIREVNPVNGYPDSLVFKVFGQAFMNAKIKPGQYGEVTLRHNITLSKDGKYANNEFVFVKWELKNPPVTQTESPKNAPKDEEKQSSLPF